MFCYKHCFKQNGSFLLPKWGFSRACSRKGKINESFTLRLILILVQLSIFFSLLKSFQSYENMFLPCFAALAVIVVCYFKKILEFLRDRNHINKFGARIYGPPTLPLIGNVHQLPSTPHGMYQSCELRFSVSAHRCLNYPALIIRKKLKK